MKFIKMKFNRKNNFFLINKGLITAIRIKKYQKCLSVCKNERKTQKNIVEGVPRHSDLEDTVTGNVCGELCEGLFTRATDTDQQGMASRCVNDSWDLHILHL